MCVFLLSRPPPLKPGAGQVQAGAMPVSASARPVQASSNGRLDILLSILQDIFVLMYNKDYLHIYLDVFLKYI
jgi:hypothetical protein